MLHLIKRAPIYRYIFLLKEHKKMELVLLQKLGINILFQMHVAGSC